MDTVKREMEIEQELKRLRAELHDIEDGRRRWKTATFRIRGTTAYVQNRFDAKARSVIFRKAAWL